MEVAFFFGNHYCGSLTRQEFILERDQFVGEVSRHGSYCQEAPRGVREVPPSLILFELRSSN